VAAEDVIDPFAGAGFLKGNNVFGLLDNAYLALVSFGVAANLTDWLLGIIVADLAASDFVLEVADGLS
jgi:hypothetical protein